MPSSNAHTSLVEEQEQNSPEQEQEKAQLRALAVKYNISLMPSQTLLIELGQDITSRMIQLIGLRVYQMASDFALGEVLADECTDGGGGVDI